MFNKNNKISGRDIVVGSKVDLTVSFLLKSFVLFSSLFLSFLFFSLSNILFWFFLYTNFSLATSSTLGLVPNKCDAHRQRQRMDDRLFCMGQWGTASSLPNKSLIGIHNLRLPVVDDIFSLIKTPCLCPHFPHLYAIFFNSPLHIHDRKKTLIDSKFN